MMAAPQNMIIPQAMPFQMQLPQMATIMGQQPLVFTPQVQPGAQVMYMMPGGQQMPQVSAAPQQPCMLVATNGQLPAAYPAQQPLLVQLSVLPQETPAADVPETNSDEPPKSSQRPLRESGRPAHNEDGSCTIRVSANTQLKGLAGTFAKLSRELTVIQADAMGPVPVSQVLRALTLTCSFLRQQHIVLTGTCEFVIIRSSQPYLRFVLTPSHVEAPTTEKSKWTGNVVLVRDMHTVGRTAGALAEAARSYVTTQRNLRLACGPMPAGLNVAGKSIAVARSMLQENGLDIKIRPVLSHSRRNKQSQEALLFDVIVFPRATETSAASGESTDTLTGASGSTSSQRE